MSNLDINLSVPSELGAIVFSKKSIRSELSRNPGFNIVSQDIKFKNTTVLNDASSMYVVLQGTALGIAAIKGIFDLIRLIAKECFEKQRQNNEMKHQIELIRLFINNKNENIVDENIENTLKKITEIQNMVQRNER